MNRFVGIESSEVHDDAMNLYEGVTYLGKIVNHLALQRIHYGECLTRGDTITATGVYGDIQYWEDAYERLAKSIKIDVAKLLTEYSERAK